LISVTTAAPRERKPEVGSRLGKTRTPVPERYFRAAGRNSC